MSYTIMLLIITLYLIVARFIDLNKIKKITDESENRYWTIEAKKTEIGFREGEKKYYQNQYYDLNNSLDSFFIQKMYPKDEYNVIGGKDTAIKQLSTELVSKLIEKIGFAVIEYENHVKVITRIVFVESDEESIIEEFYESRDLKINDIKYIKKGETND